MTLRYASLFSGIGGFDLAFDRAGMQCVAQVEIDKNCLGVLAHHWPSVKRFEDVRDVGKEQLGSVDLICGGFPCQDVSVAGRREGLAGERSGLWFEFHRIIADTLPRWVVIENVPGLLSSCGCATCGAMRRLLRIHTYLRRKRKINQSCSICNAAGKLLASHRGRDFAVILQGLVKCGYGVAWRILDAQYFGLAQRRRRVFIVGSLGNGHCAQVLFESEGVSGDSASSRETRARLATDAAASPRVCGNGGFGGLDAEKGLTTVAAPLKAESPSRRNGGSSPIADEFVIAGNLTSRNERIDAETENFVVGTLSAHSKEHGHAMTTQQAAEAGQLVVNAPPEAFFVSGMADYKEGVGTLRSSGGDIGGGSEALIAFDLAQITSNVNRTRVEAGLPASTLNQAGQMHIAYNWQSGGDVRLDLNEKPMLQSSQVPAVGVRRLTPTECERIQGFPDDWTAVNGQSDSVRYRQLGNAVAVPVVKWIGKRIMVIEAQLG